MADEKAVVQQASGMREFAEFATRQAELHAKIAPVLLTEAVGAAQIAVDPCTQQIVNLAQFMPARPARRVGKIELHGCESFIRFVNEQKQSETRVFGFPDEVPARFVAEIDFHGAADAGWRQYSAVLVLAQSQELAAWLGKNNQWLSQQEFADHLKDNRMDVASPDAAHLAELVNELELTVDRRATGKLPTNAGVKVAFVEEQSGTRNGKPVEIPNMIELAIPFFVGAELTPLQADFRVKIIDGRISFGYRLLAIQRQVRDAVMQVRAQIEEQTKLPVFV